MRVLKNKNLLTYQNNLTNVFCALPRSQKQSLNRQLNYKTIFNKQENIQRYLQKKLNVSFLSVSIMNRRNYLLFLAGGVTVAEAGPLLIAGVSFTIAKVCAKEFPFYETTAYWFLHQDPTF